MAVHGKGVASRSPTESRWLRVLGTLNEYQARLFVAQRALELGRTGISKVSRLTGMSRPAIYRGIDELQADLDLWIADYNCNRPHQGRWCFGKTPMQTFLDTIPLAKEKLMAA